MKIIIEMIKIFAFAFLTLWDIAFFYWGIFCLYGGPEANAFDAGAVAWTIIWLAGSLILALAASYIVKFERKFLLTSLILHEILLILYFVIMTLFFCGGIYLLAAHIIVLLLTAAGGYGIYKNIKAER